VGDFLFAVQFPNRANLVIDVLERKSAPITAGLLIACGLYENPAQTFANISDPTFQ